MQFGKLLNPKNERAEFVCSAVEVIVERYKAILQPGQSQPTASVLMPPRMGKSTVLRLGAMNINYLNGMPGIAIAPFVDNVDQLCKDDRITEMFNRYGIPPATPFAYHRVHKLKNSDWWKREKGASQFIVATAGLINYPENVKHFLTGIKDMCHRCGKRILVEIDECQYFKNGQAWGKLVPAIINAGGFVVVVTGTAVPGIPGFNDKYANPIATAFKLLRRKVIDGEVVWYQEEWEGTKEKLLEITADFTCLWLDAFRIGALAKASADCIDVEVFEAATGKSLGMLSKLKESQLSGQLKGVVESIEFMTKAANVAVDRLIGLRKRKKTAVARMLVVTGYDINDPERKDSNRHAQAFKKIIEKVAFERGVPLRIAIATGVTNEGEPDKEAAERIDDFRKGKFDVLIVKGMGVVGFDVPECKVLIYGSVVRTGPLAAQTLSRPLTEWDGVAAFIIMPEDCKMLRLFERTISDQGGKYAKLDVELVDEEEVDPPDPRKEWEIRNAEIHTYMDQQGGVQIGDYENIIGYLRTTYDLSGVTDLTIIEMYLGGHLSIAPGAIPGNASPPPQATASGIVNRNADLSKLRGRFGKLAGEIVSKRFDFNSDKARWRKMVAILQAKAKTMAGVNGDVPDIDDPEVLKRLIGMLPRAEQGMTW